MAKTEDQLRAEIRAEIEAELRAESLERQRTAELNASLSQAVQSAQREKQWEHGRVSAPVNEAARIIAAPLTEQMVAGMRGTTIHDDGFGDGTNR